jgi:serine/threonine-protein kinase RsbW
VELRPGVIKVTAAIKSFAREIDALGEIFEFLAAFITEHELDDRASFSLNLIVEELFTNFVRHNEGGGETIAVSIERKGNTIHLELIDDGVEPFNPDLVAEVPVEAGIDERRPGGLGIHLIRTMVDSLHYDYDIENRRLRVSIIKTLEP